MHDEKNNKEQSQSDLISKLHTKNLVTIIIAVISLITVTFVMAFVFWYYTESAIDKRVSQEIDKIKNDIKGDISDELKSELTEEILKAYAREHNLPEDYYTIGDYVNALTRPATVEISSFTDNPNDKASYSTGVFLNTDGYVLTNAHAVVFQKTTIIGDITNPSEIITTLPCPLVKGVTSNNKIPQELHIVDYNLDLDLAILKFVETPSKIIPVKLADSDLVTPGEETAVLSNLSGNGIIVTTGVVSGTRIVNGVQIIVTDTAVSDGSSGSGIFNMYAELIGLISFRLNQDASLGYAIAANEITDYIKAVNSAGNLAITYSLAVERTSIV